MKKTHKKTQKTRSYARSIASNFWVLWQPPIGNVTPYFRGLVPYGKGAELYRLLRTNTWMVSRSLLIRRSRILEQSKLWVRTLFLLPPLLNKQGTTHQLKTNNEVQVMLQDMAAACLRSIMEPLPLIPQLLHK